MNRDNRLRLFYLLLTLALLLHVWLGESRAGVKLVKRTTAGYDCTSAPKADVLMYWSYEGSAQTGNNNDYTAAEYDATNYVDSSITSTTLDEISFSSADAVDISATNPISDSLSMVVTKKTTNGGWFQQLNSADDLPTDGMVSFTFEYLEANAGNGVNPLFASGTTTYGIARDIWIGFKASGFECCLNGECLTTTTTFTVGNEYRFACRWDSGTDGSETIEIYVNEGSEGSDTAATINFNDTGSLFYLVDANSASGIGVRMDNFVLQSSATYFNWKQHFDEGCTDYRDWD